MSRKNVVIRTAVSLSALFPILKSKGNPETAHGGTVKAAVGLTRGKYDF